MLAQTEISSKVILTADRGYESYNTFAHILEKGWNFVIRGRQGDRGILSSLAIPDQEQFDVECPVVICKNTAVAPKNSRNSTNGSDPVQSLTFLRKSKRNIR